jgi:hypothetical protein
MGRGRVVEKEKLLLMRLWRGCCCYCVRTSGRQSDSSPHDDDLYSSVAHGAEVGSSLMGPICQFGSVVDSRRRQIQISLSQDHTVSQLFQD